MGCQLVRSMISMILPSLAKHYIISPVWRECRAKVERNPSNACNLLVCSCALPWLAYWCDRLYSIVPLGDRQSTYFIADRLLTIVRTVFIWPNGLFSLD